MPDTQRLARALEDRYRIERELGAGGMATVYLAHDLKHDRQMAIKVLRPELAESLGAERFLREIRITASLEHPHILTLIDSGASDGLLWYAVPYVRGESLRAWLDRDRQLSIEDTLAIARQIASALDYAHARGVIHRDVKPENILLHEREAMLADFGIALALEEAGGGRLTRTGITLGTAEYASPEQAAGDRQVDARSDIYSLGAVVYEMLAGEPPHTGPTMQAVIARILTEKPVRLRARRDSVPEVVDASVAKALARVPADRYASAGEFAAALTSGRDGIASTATSPSRRLSRWPVALFAAVVIAATLAILWRRGPPSPEATTRRQFTFSGAARAPALAPDGRTIAYVETACATAGEKCRERLLMQDIAGGQAVPLATGSVIDHPKWSPNGSAVLFQARKVDDAADTARGGTYLVRRLGGTPHRVGPAGAAAFTPRGDTIVLGVSTPNDTITLRFLGLDDGLVFDSLAVPLRNGGVGDLDWSPDGKALALLAYRGAGSRLVALVSRRGELTDTMTVPGRQLVRWVPAGDALLLLLQGSGSNDRIFRRGVNSRTGHFTSDTSTRAQVPPGDAAFDLSRDGGLLAFVNGASTTTDLTAIELDGERVASHKLVSYTGWTGAFAVSPDGGRVAFARGDAIGENIYVIAFEGGAARPVTSARDHFDAPAWLGNERLVFRKGLPSSQLLTADLTGSALKPFGPAGYTTGNPWYFQKVDDSLYALDQRELHRVLIVDSSGATRDTVTVPDSLDQLLTITPDGRQFWFFGHDFRQRTFYSLDRFTGVVSVAFHSPLAYWALGWANGDDYLFATWSPGIPTTASAPTLWRMKHGGAPTRVRELPVACGRALETSGDGRRLVCSHTERKTDIWLIQGFRP